MSIGRGEPRAQQDAATASRPTHGRTETAEGCGEVDTK